MAIIDETWRGISDGSMPPPSDPHQLKMVLVRIRNVSMHPEPQARLEALSVAGRIGTPEALNAASEYASDASLDVRRSLLALAADHGRAALPILRKLAADPDPLLAVDAIRRLTNLEDRASTSRMRGLLDARHAVVRNRAAVFLGRFGGPSIVPLLRKRASDPDQGVRAAAAWAIAFIEQQTDAPPPALGLPGSAAVAPTPAAEPSPSPRPAESPAPAEPSPSPRPAESPAPAEPPPAPAAAAPLPAANPAPADGPASADRAVDERPQPPVAPQLPAAPEPEPEPEPEPPTLEDYLRAFSGDPAGHPAALAALRAADETELSRILRALTPRGDPALNQGAARAAAALGNPRWVAPIRKLATSPALEVRAAVAGALAALCTPAVYRVLEKLAQDADPTVQAEAARALSEGARRAGFVDQARRLLQALPETKDAALLEARAQALAALDPS